MIPKSTTQIDTEDKGPMMITQNIVMHTNLERSTHCRRFGVLVSANSILVEWFACFFGNVLFVCFTEFLQTNLPVTHLLRKKNVLRKKQDDNGIGPHCVRMTNEQVTDTTFAKSGVLVAMFVPVVPFVVAFFQNKISHRHNPRPGPIMTLFKKRNQMSMY